MRRFHIRWWFIVVFFLALSVGSATFFLIQRKSFSSQNVHVVVENVDNIASGSHATFQVGIENNTNVTLDNVNLAVTLPDSMTIEGGSTHFIALHWSTIGANQKLVKDVSVAVSPGAGQGTIAGQADYSPQGVVGRFVASQNFPIIPSPLGITSLFDLPSSAVNGQEIEGSLHIIPSDNLATNDLWIELVVPQNFNTEEVSPQFDSATRWRIEGIEKGKEYVFRFRGILHGSSGDEANFRALFEEQNNGDFTTLAQNTSSVRVSQTMLAVTQIIEGAQNNVVQSGDSITIHLAYQNKSDTALEDVSLTDSLGGNGWDGASIVLDNGSWDPSTQTITWDKNKVPAFALLQPGDSGGMTFQINVKSNFALASLPTGQAGAQNADQTLTSDARITSSHQSLALGGAAFAGEDIQTLKIQGKLSLSSSATFVSSSSQGNVYTVTWKARATINDVSSVRVHALLAQGVMWQNTFTPSDALLSYSDANRTLVWNVGSVPAGTGSASQTVSFQITIPPSFVPISQIFTNQFIEGKNDFIGVQVQADGGSLSAPGY